MTMYLYMFLQCKKHKQNNRICNKFSINIFFFLFYWKFGVQTSRYSAVVLQKLVFTFYKWYIRAEVKVIIVTDIFYRIFIYNNFDHVIGSEKLSFSFQGGQLLSYRYYLHIQKFIILSFSKKQKIFTSILRWFWQIF